MSPASGDDGPTDGNIRRLGGGCTSCKEKLDECKAKLKEGVDSSASNEGTVRYLFTQLADTCKLRRIQKNNKIRYEWSSKSIDDVTYAFSDRPYRIAGATSTKMFFETFHDTFRQRTGGNPNGAITFRSGNTNNNFEGPLISVLIEAAYQKVGGRYIYELKQSEDEMMITSLDDFFHGDNDGRAVETAEFDMCSIFIDGGFVSLNGVDIDRGFNEDFPSLSSNPDTTEIP